MNVGRTIARQKFRFDLGQGFLSIVNFAFVVIAASDKLATVVQVPVKVMLAVIVPGALGAVWALGYLLDRARFYDAYQDEQNERNALLRRIASETAGTSKEPESAENRTKLSPATSTPEGVC